MSFRSCGQLNIKIINPLQFSATDHCGDKLLDLFTTNATTGQFEMYYGIFDRAELQCIGSFHSAGENSANALTAKPEKRTALALKENHLVGDQVLSENGSCPGCFNLIQKTSTGVNVSVSEYVILPGASFMFG